MPRKGSGGDHGKLDALVADAQRRRAQREQGYRARALKMYPWVCGRCTREFTQATVHELTVHHRDHNHDNNPPDGSNWELLCLFCHDNEHARLVDAEGYGELDGEPGGSGSGSPPKAGDGHQPFADLGALLRNKNQE